MNRPYSLACAVALLAGAGATEHLATEPAPSFPESVGVAQAGPEHALDFLLGEWATVGQVNSEGAPPGYGRDTVTRLFENTGAPAIMSRSVQTPLETADESAFGLTRYESISIFVFHPDSGRWRGMAHNSLGNRKWIEVEIRDGEVDLLHTGELFGGAQGVTRFTYYDITDDAFSMRVDFSQDGEEWTRGTYHLTAERVAPAAGS